MRIAKVTTLLLLLGWFSASHTATEVPYGSNPAASGTFTHDGVTLYYETYGRGAPLLIVHGNGGSIADMRAQIAHFRLTRRVIAMDSRDQGRSGDSAVPITYEKMADDLAALVVHLRVAPVDVLGWSDGGIQALLLGMRHPTKVNRLVAMAANLNPTEQALHPDTVAVIRQAVATLPDDATATAQGRRERKVMAMMLTEPNIPSEALMTIVAPTLVVAADHDMVRDEHTVEIFHALPNAQLAILPGSTHLVPYDDPATFNAIVERFLSAPFVQRDRIRDAFDSLGRMRVRPADE